MVLVYTENSSIRLDYTLDYIFNSVLGVEYRISTKLDEFNKYAGPKMSYGSNQMSDYHVQAKGLLFSNVIDDIQVEINTDDELPRLFPNDDKFLNFDVLSAVFYMISRYEEYLTFKADRHGRFPARESIAYKNGFLYKPVVNLWIDLLRQKFQSIFSDFQVNNRSFEFINTIDIDNAYAYRGKPMWRVIGALIKAIAKFNFSEVSDRCSVLLGNKKDPYDTYDFILEQHKKYQINSVMFFLLGNYNRVDKNLSHRSKLLQQLIKSLQSEIHIGIHPSYQSNLNPKLVKIEINRLKSITGEATTISRQHYLKMLFPKTYQKLIQAGIKSDYTLGFVDDWGFRAGTCVPFYFYDLRQEKKTDLLLYPTIIMEATLKNYLKLNQTDALLRIKQAVDEVFNVKGTFVSLWHNESLSDLNNWLGWKKVYLEMLDYISKKQNESVN